MCKTVNCFQSIGKQISSVEEKMEGAGYDVDYTTEFLENVNVIPELQDIQVLSYRVYPIESEGTTGVEIELI